MVLIISTTKFISFVYFSLHFNEYKFFDYLNSKIRYIHSSSLFSEIIILEFTTTGSFHLILIIHLVNSLKFYIQNNSE